MAFGRADNHSDLDEWWDETFSYFSHILIDYTEGKFPLLPDHVPIKNLTDKQNSTNPQISIYANRSMGNVVIYVRNISPTLIAESRLKIFDVSGRLVDELISQDGKFFWNSNSLSGGTYLMRLERTGIYSSQRIYVVQ